MMNEKRIKILYKGAKSNGPVIYWMSRDQRVHDNWALLFAQNLALEKKTELVVVFSLVSNYLGATIRQYDFMLKGLMEVEKNLNKYNIPFFLLLGNPTAVVLEFLRSLKVGALISDFDPLKIKRKWKSEIAKK